MVKKCWIIALMLLSLAKVASQAVAQDLNVVPWPSDAKFAGGEMIVMLPFTADPENEILSVSRGDIAYFPEMQTLCLFYGDVVPFGKVSVFARVVENLDGVRRVAERLPDVVSVPVRAARA